MADEAGITAGEVQQAAEIVAQAAAGTAGTEERENPPAEPQTREELAAAIEQELEAAKTQHRLVAMTAYRLRGAAHFCEGGLRDFYDFTGISYDQYDPHKNKKLKEWNGTLKPGFSKPEPFLDGFDASFYSETGLKAILGLVRQQQLEWQAKVRERAIRGHQDGYFTMPALVKALTRCGIEPPQVVTTMAVSVTANWVISEPASAGDTEKISITTLKKSLEAVISAWFEENKNGSWDSTIKPSVIVSAKEGMR